MVEFARCEWKTSLCCWPNSTVIALQLMPLQLVTRTPFMISPANLTLFSSFPITVRVSEDLCLECVFSCYLNRGQEACVWWVLFAKVPSSWLFCTSYTSCAPMYLAMEQHDASGSKSFVWKWRRLDVHQLRWCDVSVEIAKLTNGEISSRFICVSGGTCFSMCYGTLLWQLLFLTTSTSIL